MTEKPAPKPSAVSAPAPSSASEKHFGMFVRAVEGHLVRRHGTPDHFGASLAFTTDPKASLEEQRRPTITWDTVAVFPLSHEEVRLYGTEYRRAIKDGALRAATAAEFDADQKRQNDEAERAAKEAAKAADANATPSAST